ncbi:MAG TPA: indole-3-glycerol phosphate synthase TrpC [Candidatus Angelobacter sp.]|nr:indole-3-glycerol phosphate synthase TrpC [Candidatus Angelobacter sp.]
MSALGALGPIVARKHQEASDLRCAAGTLWAKAESMPPARGFIEALRGGTIIAEMKRRSPSGGSLRFDLDPAAVAQGYASAGAAALSVLTDGPDFGGSLDDMVAARNAVPIPVLRKDFTVDPVQIAEARVAGADAVLLIVAVLGGDALHDCIDAAQRFGVDALVEVHDEAETQRAVDAGATCIGVNNRNLRTLATDLSTFARLRRLIPADVVTVAESGVRDPGDVRRLVGEGADAVLVGEALMRSTDPAAACRELVEAARPR